MGNLCHPDLYADSNPDAYPDTGTYRVANSYGDPDCCLIAFKYSDTGSDRDIECYSNPHSLLHVTTLAHSYSNTFLYPDTVSYSNSNHHPHTYHHQMFSGSRKGCR